MFIIPIVTLLTPACAQTSNNKELFSKQKVVVKTELFAGTVLLSVLQFKL